MSRFYKRVAGVSFYQDAVGRCHVGDVVELVPEPDNVHDPNAIMVIREIELEKIGYIPRTETADIHTLLKSRRIVAVVIDKMELYPMNDGREITTVKLRVDYKPSAVDKAIDESICAAAEDVDGGGTSSVMFETSLTRDPQLGRAMDQASEGPDPYELPDRRNFFQRTFGQKLRRKKKGT